MGQRGCVFAVPAAGGTEVSGCKLQRLEWCRGGPCGHGARSWSEGGLGASSWAGTMGWRTRVAGCQ